jgi:hypothetical protein
MNNLPFITILIVLMLGIAYVMLTSDNPPDTGITQTPKQYIEEVEQNKAAKAAANETQGSQH